MDPFQVVLKKKKSQENYNTSPKSTGKMVPRSPTLWKEYIPAFEQIALLVKVAVCGCVSGCVGSLTTTHEASFGVNVGELSSGIPTEEEMGGFWNTTENEGR